MHSPGDLPTGAPDPVDDAVLNDLRLRLERYRRVPLPDTAEWERGADPDYLADLISYWLNAYDWRPHESRIRALPWATTQRSDVPVRAIHQRATRPDAPAVLLLHGWPDSVLRFERVLPLLTDFHVVVPSLPGYPFAVPVPEGGMSADAMAEAVASVMAEFGYDRYVVSAGDVGCDVAEALAALYPQRVAALHLTDVSQYHFLAALPSDLSPSERAYVQRGRDWQQHEGGYMHEQSTKPHTLAVGLGDSPAGLLAWLVEKLRSWTDCGGDVESVFSREELLTWVTAYWVSGAIGTSFTPYAVGGVKPETVMPPAVFTIFPRDLVNAPREFAERVFDVRLWREERAGGHFAAWEQPERYVSGIRDAVRCTTADEALREQA
ncbi:epoxide hydrolase family protein [Streptomyces minutiscleroticus]|uniref:epoxide hydrolase family protein n=1 Tax=Streptomyces minutiscleroticus TaxID=68238 RepID=UPI000AF15C88